jgi:hypothetical protein
MGFILSGWIGLETFRQLIDLTRPTIHFSRAEAISTSIRIHGVAHRNPWRVSRGLAQQQ